MAGSASGDFDSGDLSAINLIFPHSSTQIQTEQPAVIAHEHDPAISHSDNRGRPTVPARSAAQETLVRSQVMLTGDQLPEGEGMSNSWSAFAHSAQLAMTNSNMTDPVGSGDLPMQSNGIVMQAPTAPRYNVYPTGGVEVQRPVSGPIDEHSSIQPLADPSPNIEQHSDGRLARGATSVPSCDFCEILQKKTLESNFLRIL